MVDVRRLLLGNQLTAAPDFFADGPLDGFPLLGQITQLAIERCQLTGQFLMGAAVAGRRHHFDRPLRRFDFTPTSRYPRPFTASRTSRFSIKIRAVVYGLSVSPFIPVAARCPGP